MCTHKKLASWSIVQSFLSSADCASSCNLINETNLVHNLFSVYFDNFIYNLYILHTRHSAIQNNKYQVSHEYNCSSWWWAWRGPNHVQVIHKVDEILWEEIVHQFGFIYKIYLRSSRENGGAILEITYLTPCRIDSFEKLIAVYLLKKFEAFYGTRRFTWSFQLLLSWIQTTQIHSFQSPFFKICINTFFQSFRVVFHPLFSDY